MKIVLDDGAQVSRAHPWDGGLDLYSRDFRFIKSNGTWTFDTGVHVEIPEGYVGLIRTRSSMMREGIYTDGTIDAHYTGSIKVQLCNRSAHRYHVQAGDRIAQLVIAPVYTPGFEEVTALEDTQRGSGGFGSTGK